MRNFIIAGALLCLFSCGGENASNEVLSAEDKASLDASGTQNAEAIQFNGTYQGKLEGKEGTLEIDNETFKWETQGKTIEGKVFKVGDGSQIELEISKENSVFLNWVDENQLLILNKDGSFPEKEVFLNRI